LALDIATAPPVSPTITRPWSKYSGLSPDNQHAEALGQARPVNTLPNGNPWAWTLDHDSPPLPETTRETRGAPYDHDTAIHVCELPHERATSAPGTEGTMAGAQLSPLSVL
jgi:hypothetical protein